MFEQSIVWEHTGGRRAGALATSLMAQIAAAGVLVIAPLLYHEVLPALQPLRVLPPYVRVTSKPPEMQTAATRQTSSYSLSNVRTFTAPPQVNKLDPSAPTIIDDPQDISVGVAGPGLIGVPTPNSTIRVSEFAPPPAKPPAPAVKHDTPQAPMRVGGDVQSAKLLKKIVPVYPRMAVIARISGTVQLEGVIGRDGAIQRLKVLGGPPLLIQAAVDAVKQWVYKPTLLNGEPVEVIAPISVIFNLSQ